MKADFSLMCAVLLLRSIQHRQGDRKA